MSRFLIILSLLLGGLGHEALAQRLVTQTTLLSAGQGVSLSLKYAYRIRVRPGTGPGLTVRAQVNIADAALAKTYDLAVTTSSTEVTVKEKLDKELLARVWKHNWPDGHHSDDDKDDKVLRIDYEVTLPTATALRIETISGDIDTENLAGAVTVSTVSGELRGTGLTGPLTLHSVSGGVQLSSLPGTSAVEASSVSGDVRLSWPAARPAELSLQSISGEVYSDSSATFENLHKRQYVGHELRGRVGTRGGPLLTLRSISGNVFFRKE